MSFRETTGAREIYLAASDKRDRGTDTCAVIDVAGRDRLAQATEDLDARVSGLIDTRDSPLSMGLSCAHS
jgi:hypothetical protein